MKALKRIGLYGVSGSGKTTILKEASARLKNIIWLEGSKLVLEQANMPLAEFKLLEHSKKVLYREKAIDKAFEILKQSKKHIIIDAHLYLPKGQSELENIMTSKDAAFYTDYIYLALPPELIFSRQQGDATRQRGHSLDMISKWQEAECAKLEEFCKENNRHFYTLRHIDKHDCVKFISELIA